MEFQAQAAVKMERGAAVGAFTHWVPPGRLRYPELMPAISASLAHSLAMMPMYAAHIGSMLTGLRRSHPADLGNVGLKETTAMIGKAYSVSSSTVKSALKRLRKMLDLQPKAAVTCLLHRQRPAAFY